MNLKPFLPPIILWVIGFILKAFAQLFIMLHWEIGPVSQLLLQFLSILLNLFAMVWLLILLVRTYKNS